MRPELIHIPGIYLSIPSYGVMMVLGFIAALTLARLRSRRLGEDPDHITNFGIYALIAGVLGARAMHVIHLWHEYYQYHPTEILAIWSGGLEFLGGVLAAILVMVVYFRRRKLAVFKFLDILAPALMLGLAFGRLGCFLNGCCFGAVCDLPWAIRFPPVVSHTTRAVTPNGHVDLNYSYPYAYQLTPDLERPGQEQTIDLPPAYYDGYSDGQGHWASAPEFIEPERREQFFPQPKDPSDLTPQQIEALRCDHPMHPIHPTQLYSLLNALLLAGVLTLVFRRYRYHGQIFAYMLILYGLARFAIEMLRTEPIFFAGLTISQNMALWAVAAGILTILLRRRTPLNLPAPAQQPPQSDKHASINKSPAKRRRRTHRQES